MKKRNSNRIKRIIKEFVMGGIMWIVIDGLIILILNNLDKLTTIYR